MEAQEFVVPGTYFGRYCSDEREFEYAKTLDRVNVYRLKNSDKWEKAVDKAVKEAEEWEKESRKEFEEEMEKCRLLDEEIRLYRESVKKPSQS